MWHLILAVSTGIVSVTQTPAPSIRSLQSRDFEAYVKVNAEFVAKERHKSTASRSALMNKLKALEAELLTRLKQDRYVTDNTFQLLVHGYADLESSAKTDGNVIYPETLRFLKAAISYLDGRDYLCGNLWNHCATLYVNMRAFDKAVACYQEADNKLAPLHVSLDVDRLFVKLQYGTYLFQLNKKEKADKLFMEVVSYPFYQVREPAEQNRRLTDFYLQAALSLVETRRGNLEKLKELHFYPMADELVGPVLKEAIQQAESGR